MIGMDSVNLIVGWCGRFSQDILIPDWTYFHCPSATGQALRRKNPKPLFLRKGREWKKRRKRERRIWRKDGAQHQPAMWTSQVFYSPLRWCRAFPRPATTAPLPSSCVPSPSPAAALVPPLCLVAAAAVICVEAGRGPFARVAPPVRKNGCTLLCRCDRAGPVRHWQDLRVRRGGGGGCLPGPPRPPGSPPRPHPRDRSPNPERRPLHRCLLSSPFQSTTWAAQTRPPPDQHARTHAPHGTRALREGPPLRGLCGRHPTGTRPVQTAFHPHCCGHAR